jgi:hypothetical protein
LALYVLNQNLNFEKLQGLFTQGIISYFSIGIEVVVGFKDVDLTLNN